MMIRRPLIAAASLAALALATPLAAQETADEMSSESAEADAGAEAGDEKADMAAIMGDFFPEAEPLTPEQEAALPMAQEVVGQIFPEGTYARMMGDTMKPMMENITSSFTDLPLNQILKLTGLYGEDVGEMGDGTIAEVMAILDPAFDDRTKAVSNITIDLITEVMTEIEPAYRAGLARAYAVRFDETELADLKRYFSTPIGSKYAGESMLIYADPQVMSAMKDLMPAVMGMMPNMIERMGEVNAEFPKPRRYSELTEEEQARLSELLGVAAEDLSTAEPEEEPDSFSDAQTGERAEVAALAS